MTHVEACVPSFRIKYSQKEDEEEERQRILVIACCCNIGDEHLKIGHMLECCYKFGVLEQPVDKESEAYLDHICLLVECWSLLNRVTYISQVFFGDDECLRCRLTAWGKIKAILAKGNSIEKIFGIELVDLLRILHLLNPVFAPLDSSPGPTLRVDDLDILSLTNIGKLHIEWTSILENHLSLNLESMTLSIAWSITVPLLIKQGVVPTLPGNLD
jgi:hypothetical protein